MAKTKEERLEDLRTKRAEAYANGKCRTCCTNDRTEGYATCVDCRNRMKTYADRARAAVRKRKEELSEYNGTIN